MPRIYKKPPIVEAVCEFRFRPSQVWDWTIPGLVYERIKDQFPKKRQVNMVQFAVGPQGMQIKQEQPPAAKMQFLREDESALIQVGPDLLAINHLRPYPKWPGFKEMIHEQLRVYRQISKPHGLERIGLRYIDRVALPGPTVELEDYFEALPKLPDRIPQAYQSLLMVVEVPHEAPRGLLRFTLGTAPDPAAENELPFVLDLDLFSEGPDAPGLDSIDEWLDIAHQKVEEAFDASFTERTHKEVFEEVLP